MKNIIVYGLCVSVNHVKKNFKILKNPKCMHSFPDNQILIPNSMQQSLI